MKFKLLLYGLLVLAISTSAKPPADEKSSALKNTVILIIRHAEKPDEGRGLSPAGETRARQYADYFKHFTFNEQTLKPDYIFATADSKGSERPRLTVEPLSRALGLKIDSRFKDKDFQMLADEIRAKPHGNCILISWHHGEIPNLVQALGADTGELFPDKKWPGSVFNWVIALRFDTDGHLAEIKRIVESF